MTSGSSAKETPQMSLSLWSSSIALPCTMICCGAPPPYRNMFVGIAIAPTATTNLYTTTNVTMV